MFSFIFRLQGVGKGVRPFGVSNTANSIIPISTMYYFGFIKF